MALQILELLVFGLLCGSELNVAAFSHPTLNRQPLETHIIDALFAGSAARSRLLLLPFEHLNPTAWRLTAIAFGIQVVAILFSVVGPVPINNRIIKWKPQALPNDWRAQERLWDLYHWIRTCGLIGAFALLTASIGVR